MFKKFCIVLTICLGMFSSLAFADTVDSDSVSTYAYNVDDKSYYIIFTGTVSGTRFLYTFDSISFDSSSSYPNSYICLQSSNKYKLVDGVWEKFSGDVNIYMNGKVSDFTTNNYDVYYSIVSNGMYEGDLVDPPAIAPTVEEAIQGIAPQLLNQLKEYLPIGVILLSIALGVSLVPRLVRLFL